MSSLLDQALAEVAKLPKAEQEALAARLLDEVAAERRWDSAFSGSSDLLERLADEALEEFGKILIIRACDSSRFIPGGRSFRFASALVTGH